MKIKLSFILFLFIHTLVFSQKEEQALDSLFQHLDTSSPGVAVHIINNGKSIYNKTFGMANLEYNVPLSNEAVFDIASLAKQVTGYAIAKLELDNKLSVNNPIKDYFPELGHFREVITISHLIHHSSGLRDIGELFDIGHFGSELTASKAMEVITMQKELNFSPGTESDYSNTNYVLLALIVEKITNQSFTVWCNENIFQPIGMSNTFVNNDPKVIIPNRVHAYYKGGNGFTFDQNNGMSLKGSSAVYSTISDLGMWSKTLLLNENDNKVFRHMQKCGMLNNGELIYYGYGLGVGELWGKKMCAHTGSTPSGFRSSIAFLPEDNISVILLSNLGDINLVEEYQKPIFEILLGKRENQNHLDEENNKQVDHVELTSQQLDKFVGSYLFNQERTVFIKKNGNSLIVQPEGAPEMNLFPISENTLDFPEFRSILTFTKDKSGSFFKAKIESNNNQVGELVRSDLIEMDSFKADLYKGRFYCEGLDLMWKFHADSTTIFIKDTERGYVSFTPLTKEVFKDNQNHGFKIKFLFNIENQVIGFKLDRGSRLRNLKFERVNL